MSSDCNNSPDSRKAEAASPVVVCRPSREELAPSLQGLSCSELALTLCKTLSSTSTVVTGR